MRTIAVVAALVGVTLVVTDLRSRTGRDLALGQRPLAAPCQPGSPTRMSIPALNVDAPIETDGGFPVTLTVPLKVGWRASRYP